MSRLFQVLVVVGASATLASCGGKSERDGDDGDGDGGVPETGGGSGGASGTGGAVAVTGGGASVTGGAGSGGVAAMGGTSAGGAGGGTAGIGAVGGLPPPEVASQWDCSDLFSWCGGRTAEDAVAAWAVSAACPVDPRRPRTAADCGSDEWYECHRVFFGNYSALAVNCTCVPKGDGVCAGCMAIDRRDPAPPVIECDDRSKLCGCAYTVILE
jgi:hypothetical protein